MKIFAVLVLATAFVANTAEAGCRGRIFNGKLFGGNSSCGGKILKSKNSCSSKQCASGCASVNSMKKEEVKGTEKPKATAPSTK